MCSALIVLNTSVCLFTSPPDGPQRPSVSVSSSAEMVEGDSVTLTCSADANPAANYTWYKQDGTSDPRLLSEEPHLVFSSIQSSDSGNYSCTAENQLGRKTSDFISIDVKLFSLMLTQQLNTPGTRSMKTHHEHQDRSSPSLTSQLNTVGIITVKPRTRWDVVTPPYF
uniref:Ig-like domain-containing protein n=1 Tax=Gasterosteus aculeatus aculeatus TaxID=481459 RepID=A0AAQ4R3Q3_GASAC